MFKFYILSIFIFSIGSIGLYLTKRHVIAFLLALELIFLSININFLVFSIILDDFIGQLYALGVIAIAAAESAIGLAILVIFFRLRGGISLDLINLLKS
jgi:NADH-quinone oxidoreductase subunit K